MKGVFSLMLVLIRSEYSNKAIEFEYYKYKF